MSLMFHPRTHTASSIRPILQRRDFSVRLQCIECDRERTEVVPMVDEPNDPATSHDFFESGAVDRMDATCPYCGCGQAAILGVTYMSQPGDDRRLSE